MIYFTNLQWARTESVRFYQAINSYDWLNVFPLNLSKNQLPIQNFKTQRFLHRQIFC